jgi:sigma-B regulation protein RsbU (phosphoserine phosphatase)
METTSGSAAPARQDRNSPLVFIVDDDTLATAIIARTLAQVGLRSLAAHDKATGLEGIRQHRPDLVLLDVSLPDGNGLDICRQIQAESGLSQIPVIFVSSHEDVTMKVAGFEAGGVDYITKPLSAPEVIARVRTHLRLKQAYESLAELQAQRIQRLAVAQEAFMPQPKDFPEARFRVACKQVLLAGGDFYDVIRVAEGVVDYVVADASDHDLAASFWTAALKTLLSGHSTAINTPGEVLQFINSALVRILPAGVFFTLVHARLNRTNGHLSLHNAGHTPAILVPADGKDIQVIREEGTVLGAFSDAVFGGRSVRVRTGDRIFLYSDGLFDSDGDAEASISRLVEVIGRCRAVALDAVIDVVLHELAVGNSCQDDMVFMAIEV